MLFRLLLFIFIFSTVACETSLGQYSLRDSIVTTLKKEEPSIFIEVHNRNTFIIANQTRLYGLIGGLDYAKKVRLFIGLYGFGRENETLLATPNAYARDNIIRTISVSNFSLGMSYQYYTRGRLSLSVPLQIGIGRAKYTFTDGTDNSTIDQQKYTLAPIETGTNAYFGLLPWLGLKAGLGYRLQLGAKPIRRLNSPYYNVGLALLIKPLLSEIEKF